jgi:hypothetical protein
MKYDHSFATKNAEWRRWRTTIRTPSFQPYFPRLP